MLQLINVCGCDDTTRVIVEMTRDEAEFLTRLIQAVNGASEYGCMPTMTAELVEAGDACPHARLKSDGCYKCEEAAETP
jgi:hypothetical protein